MELRSFATRHPGNGTPNLNVSLEELRSGVCRTYCTFDFAVESALECSNSGDIKVARELIQDA